ncbi:hypothetical protein Pint_09906 [Pistacia integerrima]|uniref:Uncharacterized protein n=1 Tax=Pistacia integerrima TaxID=434235 RepID=A0ACC0XI17_9ROSI|nr:hypothetical protein Pint_09906 [Pistacia integerrima]
MVQCRYNDDYEVSIQFYVEDLNGKRIDSCEVKKCGFHLLFHNVMRDDNAGDDEEEEEKMQDDNDVDDEEEEKMWDDDDGDDEDEEEAKMRDDNDDSPSETRSSGPGGIISTTSWPSDALAMVISYPPFSFRMILLTIPAAAAL